MQKPAPSSRLSKLFTNVSLPIMVTLGFSLLQVTLPAFKPVSPVEGFQSAQKKRKILDTIAKILRGGRPAYGVFGQTQAAAV